MCLEVPNRSKLWHPESLTYKFLAEARRLWDLESAGIPCVTTVQAALFLSLIYSDGSLDNLATSFLDHALSVGKRINMFDISDSRNGVGLEMTKAHLFTAWRVFAWQTMFNYSFFRPPLMEYPPGQRLPSMEADGEWYGETWVLYHGDQNPTPLHIGHYMLAEAKLYTIINDLGFLCFGGSTQKLLTSSEIMSIKEDLDVWKENLPGVLQPRMLVFPLHFSLQ